MSAGCSATCMQDWEAAVTALLDACNKVARHELDRVRARTSCRGVRESVTAQPSWHACMPTCQPAAACSCSSWLPSTRSGAACCSGWCRVACPRPVQALPCARQVGALRDIKRDMAVRRHSLLKQLVHEIEHRVFVSVAEARAAAAAHDTDTEDDDAADGAGSSGSLSRSAPPS